MKKELFEKKCKDCGRIFRTDTHAKQCCPDCLGFKSVKKSKRRKKPSYDILSVRQFVSVLEEYNRSHNTCFTYGQFSVLVACGKIEIKRGKAYELETGSGKGS